MASNEIGDEERTLEDEDSSDSASQDPSGSEEAIFSLLFQQCDRDESGLVQVDQLVEFIRSVQMGGGGRPGDQVYDSHNDVSKLQYNLRLLKAMLECNAVDGLVDLTTYSHIIKMWVKDVRGRSHSSPPPSPPLEVSQLSDSEPATGDWSFSEHSLEASGGHTSQHSLDHVELMNSVADLRLENKRLAERNTALQVQMEGSEENLKELQSQNEKLKQDIKTVQSTLGHLTELESDNVVLVGVAQDMRGQVSALSARVGGLERELCDAQGELSSMTTQLTNSHMNKEALDEDNRALQLLLEQKEQMLSQQEAQQSQLEAQLNELQHHHSELSRTIADLNEANENLRTENADLQAHDPPLLSLHKPLFPLSSTPHRAPSWHDELSAHDSLMNRGSPIRGSPDVRMDSESFSKLLQETSVKFNSTTNKMVSEISDLINQPSPIPSRRGGESTHTLTSAERLNERSFHAFESKLSDILRQKKQLQNENIELLATVEDLKAKLAELEEPCEEVLGGTQVIPTEESAVQTDPIQIAQETSLYQQEVSPVDESSLLQLEPPVPKSTLSRSTLTYHNIEAVDFDLRQDLSLVEEVGHVTEDAGHVTEVRSRMEELAGQCGQLEMRAAHLENAKPSSCSWIGSAMVQILKGVTFALCLSLLVMLLLLALVVCYDKLSLCGPYCRHSPLGVLYSALSPHFTYRSLNRPI